MNEYSYLRNKVINIKLISMFKINIKFILVLLLIVKLVLYFNPKIYNKEQSLVQTTKKKFLYTTKLRDKSNQGNIAVLTNQDGELIQSWMPKLADRKQIEIEHVELVDHKYLYLLEQHDQITKQSFSGEELWSTKEKFHHDFHVDKNLNVYALQKEQQIVNHDNFGFEIIVDNLVKIDDQGNQVSKTNLYPAFKEYLDFKRLDQIRTQLSPTNPVWHRDNIEANEPEDLMHFNTIELVDCDKLDICEGEQVFLLSSANANIIALYDLEEDRVIWTFGHGILERPHRPTIINNNKILVFDNGTTRGYSRILIVDILSKKIEWEYSGPPKFYSPHTSGVQLLENGNFLVTVSAENKLFELSPKGRIVNNYKNILGGYRGFAVEVND